MANSVVTSDENIIEKFANIFQWKNDNSDGVCEQVLSEKELDMIAGRATQGLTDVDFENLQKDKKFAWVLGGDGLDLFLKKSNIEALRSIGCEDRFIRKKLEDGRHYRLGIFYKSEQCALATWDEALSLIDRYYSKSFSTKICQHKDAFKSMTFDEIEARAKSSYLNGKTYFKVNEEGTVLGYPYMTDDVFSACEGTLEEARGFLYNRLGFTGLFDGSGYTKDSAGQLHVKEYLQLNLPVRDIPGFRYLHIPIDMNDLHPDA